MRPRNYTSADNYVLSRHYGTGRLIACEHFFMMTRNGRELIYTLVGQKAIEVSGKTVRNSVKGKGFTAPYNIDDNLPHVVDVVWCPIDARYVWKDSKLYRNSYVAPFSRLKEYKQETRPEVWQQLLDYWLPDPEHAPCQDVIDTYVADLIFNPETKPQWALMIRSAEGIGKGVLANFVLSPLLGADNVRTVSLQDISGRFTRPFLESKALIINEAKASGRSDVYNRLKEIISDPSTAAARKGVDSEQVDLFNGTFIFSNYKIPLSVPDGARRFYVLPYINKADGLEAFLRDTFIPFLDTPDEGGLTGLDLLRGYFKHVSENPFVDVRESPQNLPGNHIEEISTTDAFIDDTQILKLEMEQSYGYAFQHNQVTKDSRFLRVSRAQFELAARLAGLKKSDNCFPKGGKKTRAWVHPGVGTTSNPAQMWLPNEQNDPLTRQAPDLKVVRNLDF